jgi:hypothetical protein
MIKMMKLTDLLSQIDDSCDFSQYDAEDFRSGRAFLGILDYKAQGAGFWELYDDVMENGIQGAIGFYRGGITEGHHRLCIAILAALDEVPVDEWGSSGGRFINSHAGNGNPAFKDFDYS